MKAIRSELQRLGPWDWGRWCAAIAVALAVALGLFSLFWLGPAAPGSSLLFSRWLAITFGLLGLLLLLGIYIGYQQVQAGKLQEKLAEQVAAGSRLQTQTEELQRLAMMDPLTGLYNRQFLNQHLAKEAARSQRQGHPLNGLLLHLFHFQQINKIHGSEAADGVLREFAQRLKNSIRSSDLAVRVSSDAFLILLMESSIERIPHILARLSGMEVDLSGSRVPIPFAAGWAACQPQEQPHQFLERLEWEVREDQQTGQSGEAIRRAQTEIRQTQNLEALGRLAGKVAHDFNNLLNLVKGYSELVLDGLGQNDPLREYVEQIHQANEQANSLTRQLLAFTRNSLLTSEVLDLNFVLYEMQAMLQRLMGEEIGVVTRPGDALGLVSGIRGQIEQVLLNLAVHSRNRMPQGGKFFLETTNVELGEEYTHWHPGARPGSYVLLTVRDTGTGLDSETVAQLFEPFATKQKGQGLGLAAVYGIVKQNGGYIWVDSALGQDTTFSLYWPRVEQTARALGKPVGKPS